MIFTFLVIIDFTIKNLSPQRRTILVQKNTISKNTVSKKLFQKNTILKEGIS